MSYRLTVPNVDTRTFYSYWYGAGDLVSVEDGSAPSTFTFIVMYPEDAEFYAQYQADRFASGLYFAKVEKV